MIKVRYYCPFAKRSGYAQAAHDYLAALYATGKVELDIRPIHECDTDADLPKRFQHLVPFVNAHDSGYEKADPAWPDVVIVHTIPHWADEFVTGDLAPTRAKKVCLTTWETDRLPDGTAEKLNAAFDLVIVPCYHNRSVFQGEGVNVKVVPHTFDPEYVLATRKKSELTPPPQRPLTFYSILVWAERKNPIGLLKAYLTEFNDKDNVLLKILTPQYSKDDLLTLVRRMGITDLPRVAFITERLSDEALWRFHEESDVYVSMTRGEGWGLGAFEAAITGNPVITTGWSGHMDFLASYENFWDVPYSLTPAVASDVILDKAVEIGGVKLTTVKEFVATGVNARQKWAEPDLETAQYNMRDQYGTFERRGNVRKVSWFDHFRQTYGYETVGTIFVHDLERLLGSS